MAQRTPDQNLARLLAGRDEPSVLEKEAQFERIFAEVQAEQGTGSAWWRRLYWVAPVVAAVGAVLLFLPRTGDEFSARGPSTTAIVRGYCAGPGVDTLSPALPGATRCEVGEHLLLRLMPPKTRPFAAAYIERADGRILWLFPGRGESMPRRPPTENLFPRSFELSELPAGTHQLHVLFSADGLSRDALARRLEASDTAGLTRVEQTLVLDAAGESP